MRFSISITMHGLLFFPSPFKEVDQQRIYSVGRVRLYLKFSLFGILSVGSCACMGATVTGCLVF